ncbi:hypothetical protein D9619_007370 [Psilocybe cf. subviscida]|uniref:Carbohydrate esterase family 16 protein n=1 Tax=Psilocybe cf. subviscida TaxID=2480587 RepID=A0A8H5EWQ1_9AGAR|nr:hypothetical protein D9619_007370 [Psilocybe cf. subviscida]
MPSCRTAVLSLALCTLFAAQTLSVSLPQNVEDTRPSFNWDRIKYVHAFGDSYSFVQGTEGHANFRQALKKVDALAIPTIAERNNIKKYKLGRGELGCFQGPPSKCERQLWDFAFAGADIDANILPRHENFDIPLVDQVKQWLTYAADIIPHPADETLTTWWIGINDTGDTVNNATISDFNAFWNVEMASYFNAVQAATNRGLRTHLFINVPPEDRTPGALSNSTRAALLKDHINQFNTVLAAHVSAFQAANPDTRVMTFDAHKWFNMVLDNPRPFGFTNTTGFCTCAQPTEFFWFNMAHPTERVHKLLAQAIEQQLRNQ